MNTNLVSIDNGPVTSTEAIADAFRIEHASVVRLVRKHRDDLEKFGSVDFREVTFMTNGGAQRRYTADLNAAQTAFVVSSLRNKASSKVIGGLIAALPEQYRLSVMDLVNDMDIEELDRDMSIYVILETESKRVKIGISRDPERRVRELQVGNSQKLELIAHRKAENGFSDEARLHRIFASDKVRGEWFSTNALEVLA